MSLKLKIFASVSLDAAYLFLHDNTGVYTDGDDHGWGGGDPVINREDRCLVCFSSVINDDGTTDRMETLEGVNAYYHLAPGSGLANTAQSRFTFKSTRDAHYRYWLFPAEQYASAPAPSLNGVYYDTTELKLKISDGTLWRDFTANDLSVLETKTERKMCENIYFVRKIILRNLLAKRAYLTEPCDKKYLGLLEELNGLILIIGSSFAENNQATARSFLKQIEDKFHEYM